MGWPLGRVMVTSAVFFCPGAARPRTSVRCVHTILQTMQHLESVVSELIINPRGHVAAWMPLASSAA
eukprot:8041156-Prorocentrum_lima.AAC.1